MTTIHTIPERLPLVQVGVQNGAQPDTLTGKWAADGMKQLRALLEGISQAEADIVLARHEAEVLAKALTAFGLDVPALPWQGAGAAAGARTGKQHRIQPGDTCLRCAGPVAPTRAKWRRFAGREGFVHYTHALCQEATR